MVLWAPKIWEEVFFFAICCLLIVGKLSLIRMPLSIGRGGNSSSTVEKVVGGNAVVGRSS